MNHPKGKGAWYFTTVFECPLCGGSKTYRERRWDEKPASVMDRYAFVQDACSGHFL